MIRGIFNDFKTRAELMQTLNYIFVDVVHGFNVPEMIYETIIDKEMDRHTIIYAGEEQKRQLLEYSRVKNIQFRLVDLYGDLVTVKDGIISLNMMLLGNTKSFSVWCANLLVDDVFNAIVSATYNIPIFFIGDSDYYCVSHYIHDLLNRTPIYMCETSNKITSYNLEVIYLNKRIRTGDITKLEETRHRSYDILKRDLYDIQTKEYLDYDMVITACRSHIDLNNEIRDMLGFTMMPNINEPMINVCSVLITDLDGKKLHLPEYSILKVIDVINEGGALYVIYEYDGRLFKTLIDTHFLNKTTGRSTDGIRIYNGGLHVEYAYVIIPLYALYKSFDNVLVLYSNKEHSSTRNILTQLVMSTRKKITIYTDYYYNLY